MNCPKCNGCSTTVRESSSDIDAVYRKRLCKECGHVFYTFEITAETCKDWRDKLFSINPKAELKRVRHDYYCNRKR